MRSPILVAVLCLSACGGGGGGTVTPAAVPVHLEAAPLDLAPATTAADLLVELGAGGERPVLLQVTVELPPALAFAATDRLRPATALVTLDGEAVNQRLAVLCGDASNPSAAPLTDGGLFRVRVVAATPRQVGTHTVRITGLLASAADGTPLAVATEPLLVPVQIR